MLIATAKIPSVIKISEMKREALPSALIAFPSTYAPICSNPTTPSVCTFADRNSGGVCGSVANHAHTPNMRSEIAGIASSPPAMRYPSDTNAR